jgi:hypothetical protein
MPSQNIIERGRAICECDEIMQILPVRLNKTRFIDVSMVICNGARARSRASVAIWCASTHSAVMPRLDRGHPEYAAAPRLSHSLLGILDRPVKAGR